MGTRTLDEAMEGAHAFRMLRTIDLHEARRVRELVSGAGDELERRVLTERVTQLVAHARKWNRQLIIAERDIRTALFARLRRSTAPRGFVHVLHGLGVSVGPPHAGLRDAGAE